MGPKRARRHQDDDEPEEEEEEEHHGGGRRGGGRSRGIEEEESTSGGGGRRARGAGGRKKSLLIGINYTGSSNPLNGCEEDVENVAEFLTNRGYPRDKESQMIMTEDHKGKFYPTGKNILAAMDWLVSEPGTSNFLHYSGHGGQVEAPDRELGFDDTIVPIDYEKNGQISSDTLHRHLVSKLPPRSTLFVILDCCHSGSAIELPYVYRTDGEGNVSFMDNIDAAKKLMGQAGNLIQGGFSLSSLGQAKDLAQGASALFSSFTGGGSGGGDQEEGIDEADDFGQDWSKEKKTVTMFSGCMDEQTSADASIGGEAQGAMSWAFLATLAENPDISYIDALVKTREKLKEGKYTQVPQLSVGFKEFDLNQSLKI